MRSGRLQAPSSGFTLIEVLVAFTMLGMVMTVTFSVLATTLTMWSSGYERIDQSRSRHIDLSVVREQLQSALPLIVQTLDGDRITFSGARDRVDLVSAVSGSRSDSVPRWIGVFLNASDRDPQLTIEERRVLSPGNSAESIPYASHVVSGVNSLEIAYLQRSLGQREPEWLDAWSPDEQTELPAAVRLVIEFQDGRNREILVPLDYAPANWDGMVVR